MAWRFAMSRLVGCATAQQVELVVSEAGEVRLHTALAVKKLGGEYDVHADDVGVEMLRDRGKCRTIWWLPRVTLC
eukprot:6481353-Amphidinium_carterae.1